MPKFNINEVVNYHTPEGDVEVVIEKLQGEYATVVWKEPYPFCRYQKGKEALVHISILRKQVNK